MKTIILFLVIALVSGCSIYESEISNAQAKCTDNGGLKYLTSSGSVRCNNGALFTL